MGGGGRGGSTFWNPPSRILLRHFLEILFIYLESSAQELSIGTLFEVSGGTADAQWGYKGVHVKDGIVNTVYQSCYRFAHCYLIGGGGKYERDRQCRSLPIITEKEQATRVTRMAYSPRFWLMAIGW